MLVGIHFVWKWVPIRWLPDAPHRWWWYWSLCQHWYQHSTHMMKYRSINSIESSKKNTIFGRYGSLFALCFRVIIYVVINLTWQRQWHKNERAHILNQQKKKTSHTNNGVVKYKDAVDNNGVNHLSTKYGLAWCFNCAKKDEMKAKRRN